jgi:pSer/pThr/pTyr-binding forkhead associated (FHA) protein
MSKLIFSLDGAFLGEFPIEHERMTIGRRPGNDIHIDNLAISGEHAAITMAGSDCFIEDLDSTNGTMVNGKAIKKHRLQHGEVIELGKYQLKFVSEATLQSLAGSSEVDYEKTMIIRPSAMRAAMDEMPKPSAPEPAAAPQMPEPASALPSWARPMAAVTPSKQSTAAPSKQPATTDVKPALAQIQVLNGPSTGKELVLSKALTTLGKPGVQVAVISRRPHGYFVTHVEGVRHPIVNGVSVGAQAHQLKDHDVVEIAGVKMEFYFVDA